MKNNIIEIHKKKLSELTDNEINISKYRSLERRYNSLIEALTIIESQNKLFRKEVESSHQRCLNAQKNVEINKKIVMDLITDTNKNKESYLSEISELKRKLRDH